MRIDRLSIQGFRNLENFSIDLDERKFATVLIGENGTGKSNLIEAIVLIFRDLDLAQSTPFDFHLVYRCRGERIEVEHKAGNRPVIRVGVGPNQRILSWAGFLKARDQFLPKYIFAYYSGPSGRLRSYFESHQNNFYHKILNAKSGQPPPLRRLFYCLPEHSRWVLLAYFLRSEEPPAFLRRYFEIEAFDSALLVLRRPPWAKDKPSPDVARLGDSRFWYARGTVKNLLRRLWDESLAPIMASARVQEDYRSKARSEEQIYLYLPSREALERIAVDYRTEASFFAALESTEISNLVRDVRVRVKRAGASIVFSELSEGEQQLLTVVGLMQFTRHEESLFLLDEPDTHLNPHWKLKYLEELTRQTGLAVDTKGAEEGSLDSTSQLILTTHDPLTIAGLEKAQVQIFRRSGNQVIVEQPSVDPRGLGVSGVLLRMFGLPSTLDLPTQEKIRRRDELARKMESRSLEEDVELRQLSEELGELGLLYETRDPLYSQFLEALRRRERKMEAPVKELPPEEQERIVDEILAELMEAER
ncbi:MAG: AAA family ATPase [Thermoanaerobaculia bacterium]|nr:AAA family ATPase [Thermoanaerobaculia bacterium]